LRGLEATRIAEGRVVEAAGWANGQAEVGKASRVWSPSPLQSAGWVRQFLPTQLLQDIRASDGWGREADAFAMTADRQLFLACVGILLMLGTLFVHSASNTSRPSSIDEIHLSRHLVYVVVGLTSALIAGAIPSTVWRRWAPVLFGASVVLLVLVLIPGVGSRVKGAQRWFRFFGLSLQPSELAKLTVPLWVCRLATERIRLRHHGVRGVIPTVVPVAVAVPLVLLQPDLGTSLFLILGTAIALFVAGWPLRWFGLGFAVAGPALGATMLAKPYQLQRVRGFLETWHDWTQAPYHLKQSLVTLGAGGTWGTGVGRGTQKLSFLPEAHTDFVFAVLGEELGLVGAVGILVLWGLLFVVGLRLLGRVEPGRFEHAAAATLLTQIVLQAVINVAVVTALVPPKGIPHPLLSYGGTNLVVTLTGLGLLFSLTRHPNLPSAAGGTALAKPAAGGELKRTPWPAESLSG